MNGRDSSRTTLPASVVAEVKLILDAEARRILAKRLSEAPVERKRSA